MTLAIGWPHDGGETVRAWPHEPGDWQAKTHAALDSARRRDRGASHDARHGRSRALVRSRLCNP